MSTHKKWKPTARQRELIGQLCDADSYLTTITDCVDEKQRKKLRPYHMANSMALVAELFLQNYDGISTAFERNGSLEVTFKAKLAQDKDTVEVSYKPVDTFKGSASADLPDEDQEVFDFAKSNKPTPARSGAVVDAEVIHSLPPPMMALPAPPKTAEEEDAYQAGMEAAAMGESYSTNPHPFSKDPTEGMLWNAWADGWTQGDAEKGSTVVLDDDADLSDPDQAEDKRGGCLEDREDLSDATEEE